MKESRDIPVNLKVLLEAVASGLTYDVRDIEKIEQKDPEVARYMRSMQAQGDVLTGLIGALRDPERTDLPPINELMSDVWNIIHHGIVKAAAVPDAPVPTMSFMSVDRHLGLVLLPTNLTLQAMTQPFFIMGGGVNIGSHVRDFYNDRLDPDEMEKRGAAYEAEFLLFLQRKATRFELNAYQREVLERYPRGLASCSVLYAPKPTPPARPLDLSSAPSATVH